MRPLLYSILYSADVWRPFLTLSATSPGIEGIENRFSLHNARSHKLLGNMLF
jgi:hypothetical protein